MRLKKKIRERAYSFCQGYVNYLLLNDFQLIFFSLLCYIQVPFKIIFRPSPISKDLGYKESNS